MCNLVILHTFKLARICASGITSNFHKQYNFIYCLQPGQVKYLEEGPSRCFQPSQMAARKKKNRDLKVKEVKICLLIQ